MCTISIAVSRDGSAVRLLMNRDERRLRPAARPPVVQRLAGITAVWPEDPAGSGTWIAATDAGLALAVLNVDAHRTSPRLLSRGLVIPRFAVCATIDEVEDAWAALDQSAFAPFRCLVATRTEIAEFSSVDGAVRRMPLGAAHLFASSSLGDALVEPLRTRLFSDILRTEPDPWLAQTRLHQHSWPDRRNLSVMMTRIDACTVSQTEIRLEADEIALAYRPVIDGWPMGETRRALPAARSVGRAA